MIIRSSAGSIGTRAVWMVDGGWEHGNIAVKQSDNLLSESSRSLTGVGANHHLPSHSDRNKTMK